MSDTDPANRAFHLRDYQRESLGAIMAGYRAGIRSTIKMSEAHVTHHLTESVGLVARNTRWRRAPASYKQLRVLRSKKIKVPKGLTKGQASHLISMLP
jgi:hypothetical protein